MILVRTLLLYYQLSICLGMNLFFNQSFSSYTYENTNQTLTTERDLVEEMSCDAITVKGYEDLYHFTIEFTSTNTTLLNGILLEILTMDDDTFYGNLTLTNSTEIVNANYTLPLSLNYYRNGTSYTETITYRYVYNDQSSPSNCTITFTVCGENCKTCSQSNYCESCHDNFYFLTGYYDRCVEKQSNQYFVNSQEINYCSAICGSCESESEYYTHNCLSCANSFYSIAKENTVNCYSLCPGPVSSSTCNSLIYFKRKSDTESFTDISSDEMYDKMNYYFHGLMGVNTKINGPDYVLDFSQLLYQAENVQECVGQIRTTNLSMIPINDDIYVGKLNVNKGKEVLFKLSGGNTISNLNTSYCVKYVSLPDSLTISPEVLIKMQEMGVNVFDPKDPFFNDICFSYSADNGTDMTLKDRRNYIFQNISVCGDGYEFESYDPSTELVKCKFLAKESEPENYEFATELIEATNIMIAKCYKVLGNGSNYPHNIGFWVVLSIILICFGAMIYYYTFYKHIYLSILFPQVPPQPTEKTEGDKDCTDVVIHTTYKNIKITNTEERNTEPEKEEKKEEEEEDLNKLTYNGAKEKDKRSMMQMFWYISLTKVELLTILVFPGPYDIVCINLSLYLFSLGLDFTINAMLFSDDVISQKFHNGEVRFITTLILSILSNILTYILSYFVVKCSTFAYVFEDIKNEIKDQNNYVALCAKVFKEVCFRLKIFFIIEFVILLFCLYYVTIFCSIYKESQTNWFDDCLTSIGTSLVYSIGMALFISALRYISLKGNFRKIYNISRSLIE